MNAAPQPSPLCPNVVCLDAVCAHCGATLRKLERARTCCFCPACERKYTYPELEPMEEAVMQ